GGGQQRKAGEQGRRVGGRQAAGVGGMKQQVGGGVHGVAGERRADQVSFHQHRARAEDQGHRQAQAADVAQQVRVERRVGRHGRDVVVERARRQVQPKALAGL